MRVALANCHRQVVGGAESYIKGSRAGAGIGRRTSSRC